MFNIENSEGGEQPLFRGPVTESASGGRGLNLEVNDRQDNSPLVIIT